MRATILAITLIAVAHPANAADTSDIPLPVRRPGAAATPPPDVWSEEEIDLAKDQCAKLIVPIDLVFAPLPPIKEKGCGAPVPILLTGIGSEPQVRFHPPATVNCALAERLNAWLTESVQPLAKELLKAPISEMHVISSYACRHRYNDPSKPLSEHAKANAIDIAAFKTAKGEWIRVLDHWGMTQRDLMALALAQAEAEAAKDAEKKSSGAAKADAGHADPTSERASEGSQPLVTELPKPDGPEKSSPPTIAATPQNATEKPEQPDPHTLFVRGIHADACRYFGTVLGPEANESHQNHFHLDLAPRKRKAYCE